MEHFGYYYSCLLQSLFLIIARHLISICDQLSIVAMVTASMREQFWGLSHYSPPPHEIIAPHCGIITIIGGGGAIGYLTTKLGGGGGGGGL